MENSSLRILDVETLDSVIQRLSVFRNALWLTSIIYSSLALVRPLSVVERCGLNIELLSSAGGVSGLLCSWQERMLGTHVRPLASSAPWPDIFRFWSRTKREVLCTGT